MNLLNPGVERIILYNDSNTYTLSGNDISPQSTLTRRIQTRTGSRGGYLPFLVEHTLELQISDTSLYEAIEGQRFNVFIEKFNGFYVWGVNERIIKEEDILFDTESEEYPLLLKAKNISESPEIGQDGNMLGEFVDLNADGTADGWSTVGGTTSIFSNGQQTVEVSLFRSLDFGYSGQTYTFSVEYIDIHQNATNFIRINYLDDTSIIRTDENEVTATGVHEISTVSPAGTVAIQIRVGTSNITQSGFLTVTNPKLTIQ